MKTLKRTLCLVLALVLAIGTMGVASAVTYDDYTDADEINPRYAEAVEVTTALGIIDGMTDTAFVPDGNLTRAQAAKIVAYLMFGDAASILAVQSETKFTDVPKDFWASGYIAALTDAGVIAGMTDTTFEPNAPLTGYQWAKMCLCAMGYSGYVEDRYDEIFEGEFWAANVAKYALHAGLLDAMESTYFLGDVIKRDEAVQMGFYAMLNDYHEGRVVTIVPDGNGGWRLEIVVTPIETLAIENYGLVVEEGIIWKDNTTGTYWLRGYGDDEFNLAIDIRLTEDVAAYEGRHAYVWGTADDMRDLTVATQLTDVNLLDAYTELTAEDVAAVSYTHLDVYKRQAMPTIS